MKKAILYLVLLFVTTSVFAKDTRIDSLKLRLSKQIEDTARVNTLVALGIAQIKNNPKESAELARQAQKLAEKINYETGLADAYAVSAEAERWMANYDQSLADCYKALEIFEKQNNKKKTAELYLQYARLYDDMKTPAKNFEYLEKAKQIFTELKEPKNVARVFDESGRFFWRMQVFDKALLAFRESEKLKKQCNDERGLAHTYQWMGTVYYYLNEFGKAKEYYLKSRDLAKKYNLKPIITFSIQNMGFIYKNEKNYKEAEKLFFESLALFREEEDTRAIIFTYEALGALYQEQKIYDRAISLWNEGIAEAKRVGHRTQLMELYQYLQNLYSETGDYKNAFEYQTKYFGLKDSLINEENSRKMSDFESKYETEKKDAIAQQEKKREEVIRNFFIVAFILTLIVIGVVFRGYRQKQKANIAISIQKEVIEEKNKNITDSINYAKRIQEAVLTPRELKSKLFPNSFVLYQPRDIVSGDFYWFTEKNGRRLISAVDCTGHGVPGAFMSIIGNNFLNEIVNDRGITRPSEILDLLRQMVIESLKQAEGESKDGMDIAILSFDEKNNFVEFAGANNPLWLIRNKTLSAISADKQPIGFHEGEMKKFTNHKIELQKNDSLYIFTDGFADQFGGKKGKKFKYRQLQEILLSVQDKTMETQELTLRGAFATWKGGLEQVDDVLVMGIKM